MRRWGRASGLPNSSTCTSGLARACSRPWKATLLLASWARITRLAAGATERISGIGSPSTARRCSSNSLRFCPANVTSPVSWGLGDSSENTTSLAPSAVRQTKNSTPKMPAPPRLSVTWRAMVWAAASWSQSRWAGCQLHW